MVGTGGCAVHSHSSCVCPFVTPWTVTCQAALSTGVSRHEYGSGLPCPPPGDPPNPGIAHISYASCTGRQVFYPLQHLGSPTRGSQGNGKLVFMGAEFQCYGMENGAVLVAQ